jgi:hypothetical protein
MEESIALAGYQNIRETKLTKSKSLARVAYGIFAGIVLMTGIVAIDASNYIKAVEIEKYAEVNGQVADSGVLTKKRMRTHWGRSEWNDADFCFIKYSYVVQGKQYFGEWEHALDEKFTSVERRKLLRSWNVGETITVFYNPTNHAISELIRPSRWPSWWHWLLCALSIWLIWVSVDDINKELKLRRRVRDGESVLFQADDGELAFIFEKRKETECERRYKQREQKAFEELAKTLQARREGRIQ